MFSTQGGDAGGMANHVLMLGWLLYVPERGSWVKSLYNLMNVNRASVKERAMLFIFFLCYRKPTGCVEFKISLDEDKNKPSDFYICECSGSCSSFPGALNKRREDHMNHFVPQGQSIGSPLNSWAGRTLLLPSMSAKPTI